MKFIITCNDCMDREELNPDFEIELLTNSVRDLTCILDSIYCPKCDSDDLIIWLDD